MAKFGTMKEDTKDCSRVNCSTNSTSDDTTDENAESQQENANHNKTDTSEDAPPTREDSPENSPSNEKAPLSQGDHKITTAASLIIESLLQNLCQVYIPDAEQSRRYYQMICQMLYQMRVIDESYRMSEFEGMRNQYQRVFHHLLQKPVGLTLPTWPSNDVTNEWSHYHREFDEMKYIAGGGFGHVYLVKHKLDGSDYAVKKIYIRSRGIKSVMKYLSEVKTFAALNHANIVQYKAAWLELGVHANNNNFSDNSDSDDSYEINNLTNISKKSSSDNRASYIYPDIVSSVEMSFKKDEKSSEDSSDFEVQFQESQRYSYNTNSRVRLRRINRKSISEGNNFKKGTVRTMQEIKTFRLHGRQRKESNGTVDGHKWATLYIQMALCPLTMQQWLVERNQAEELAERNVAAALVPVGGPNVRHETIMEILRQLLKGLKYIHSKKIVHHDIKPSNIFIHEDNGCMLVQLGDFGLACPLQSARHSIAGGTKLYAAPEQIQGTCVSKSDMYSVGIVLMELAASFRTDMERVANITQLRNTNGQSADALLVKSIGVTRGNVICRSQIAAIISQVMLSAHVDRPDADGLLTILAHMATESDCTKVSKETPCTKLVQELRAQLVQKDAEIVRLRDLLEQAGIQGVHIHVNSTDSET